VAIQDLLVNFMGLTVASPAMTSLLFCILDLLLNFSLIQTFLLLFTQGAFGGWLYGLFNKCINPECLRHPEALYFKDPQALGNIRN
jgi:hypothetical protein